MDGCIFLSLSLKFIKIRNIGLHIKTVILCINYESICRAFGIFDRRRIGSKIGSEIIMQDLGKALTSAFYSATGSYVLTTSNDDTIKVYDCRDNKSSRFLQ